MEKLTYAVLGSGALGGLYGAMLARSGHDVHFLLRSDYEHVRDHGWKIESHWGDFELPSAKAHQSVDTMPACDVTIVALKTVKNEVLPDWLPSLAGESGHVLVLQNGLGIENEISQFFDRDRILGGCCFLCCNKVGPGHIRHLDYGRIVFGPHETNAVAMQMAQRIGVDLNDAGIEAQVSDDLNSVRWRKLMWNIPYNGLSVALDASTDKLMASEVAVDLIRSLVTEVHSAATACGAKIGAEWIEKTIEHTREMVPYDSSMRLDFLAGRPMELRAILQNPINAAEAAGAEMPRTQVLCQQLAFLQERRSAG